MHFDTETVTLSHIDRADVRLRVTTRQGIDDLVASIRRLGLMNPPLLRKDATGYAIICGFRRVAACARLKMARITARVTRADRNPLDEVLWAVADNSLQRPLNMIETSRAVSMLSGATENPDLLKAAAAVLGLPRNHAFLNKIEPLCRMPEPVQRGLIDGAISLNTAVDLGTLRERERILLANLLNTLRFSRNKQKEVIDLVKEISLRENIGMEVVLSAETPTRILEDEHLDRNQKGAAIRAYLRKRRFPEITTVEEKFKEAVKAMKLGNTARLSPPKSFEGTTFTLQLSFDRLEELIAHQDRLHRLVNSSYMQSILG